MKVTEDQAKQKWCPMTHIDNRSPKASYDERFYLCRGSDCMLWQWSVVKDQTNYGLNRDLVATGNMLDCLECEGTGKDGDGDQCMECSGSGKHPEFVQRGYCGLSGGAQ